MPAALVQSIVLIAVGAAITLVSTLLAQWLGAWQATKLDRERRADEAKRAVRDSLMDVARTLSTALLDLVQMGVEAGDGEELPPRSKDLILVVRHNYLLVPDVAVRASLSNALSVVGNREKYSVTLSDWMRTAAMAAFVVAAYIRNEALPVDHVDGLVAMKAKYKPEKR